MTPDTLARRRWFLITGIKITGALSAVLGLLLIAKAHDWPPKILGAAMVLMAIYFATVIPLSLAHRWRTPPE